MWGLCWGMNDSTIYNECAEAYRDAVVEYGCAEGDWMLFEWRLERVVAGMLPDAGDPPCVVPSALLMEVEDRFQDWVDAFEVSDSSAGLEFPVRHPLHRKFAAT